MPGGLYHVYDRRSEKRKLFLDRRDREKFLDCLADTIGREEWICHAYCLMTNHYHLLLETPLPNLSHGMRILNGWYATYFNRKHEHVGHLFQGRFGSSLVQRENYLIELVRYILLNPVRAGMVEHPSHYRWSSYSETVGVAAERLGKPVGSNVLEYFGGHGSQALEAFICFIREGMEPGGMLELDLGEPVVGDAAFRKSMIERFGAEAVLRSPAKPPMESPLRPPLDRILAAAEGRDRHARNAVIRKAVEQYGYEQTEIARSLGLHKSTVCKIVKGAGAGSAPAP